MNERIKGGKEIKELTVDIDVFMFHYELNLFRKNYKLDIEREELKITYKVNHFLHEFILEAIQDDGGPKDAKYEIENVSSNGLILVKYEA